MSIPAPKIPGFYFDAEKNRYFKIPVTGIPQNINKPQSIKNEVAKKKTVTGNSNEIIKNREIGSYKNLSIFEKKMISTRLMTFSSYKADTLMELHETENFHDLVCSPLNDCVFLSQSHPFPVIWRVTNTNNKLEKEPIFSRMKGSIANMYYCEHSESGVICVLIEDYNSTKVLQTSKRDSQIRVSSKKSLPTCAWSKQSFAYSKDEIAVFRGSTNGRTTCESCITKQTFSQNGSLLYNGLKNGKTTVVSLQSKRNVFSFKPDDEYKFVADIHILRDDNSIVSRNVAKHDVLFLWDRRMLRKPVLQYTSIPHSYHKNTKKRLQIDTNERFLTCVNVDGVIRIWDIQSGNLASSILPQNQPIVAHYEDNWPLFGHKQGILCVGKKGIAWYGNNSLKTLLSDFFQNLLPMPIPL